jgi:hypothetical protein
MKGWELTEYMVEGILYLSITDDPFLRFARGIITPEMLGEIPGGILRVIYRFYDESLTKEAPKDHFADEFDHALEQGIVAKGSESQLRALINKLASSSGVNREYIIKRVDQFARKQGYLETATRVANLARRWDLEGAKAALIDVLKIGAVELNLGTDFFSSEAIDRRMWRRNTARTRLMPFGIEPFDRRGAHLQRKFFILIMGQEKKGKSWGGVFFGRGAILKGLNTLHVTHGDLTRDALEDRYDMNLSGAAGSHLTDSPDAPLKMRTRVLVPDGEGGFTLQHKMIRPGTIKDYDKVRRGVRAAKQFGGRLIIKDFPRGSCTVPQFESYLDSLEINEGFVPDVIINDYPDIMKLPSGEYRHGINYVYEAHARIADERNLLMIGFSQVSTKAYGKKYITMAHFAEDKRKAAHCDGAFAICQSPEEEKQGKVRFVWVVDRHFGMEGYVAGIVQDYRIGQFCKQSYDFGRLAEGMEEEEERGPEKSSKDSS